MVLLQRTLTKLRISDVGVTEHYEILSFTSRALTPTLAFNESGIKMDKRSYNNFGLTHSYSDFWARSIDVPQAEMDTLGAHGWELVDVYTRIETVHPNFGNEKYVTGLQANTRTAAVCYVFKRPLREGQLDCLDKNEAGSDTVAAVEEVAVEVADTVAY